MDPLSETLDRSPDQRCLGQDTSHSSGRFWGVAWKVFLGGTGEKAYRETVGDQVLIP